MIVLLILGCVNLFCLAVVLVIYFVESRWQN